ncbi:hypothetical protein Tco_1047044 [Tanacetum coccineum]
MSENTGPGEKKTMKKPIQTSRGVPVDPKIGFKPHKEYRHVPKKSTASFSGNRRRVRNLLLSSGTTPIIEKIRKFEDLLTSWQTILVDKEGNHLKKIEFSGEDDSEDEVASVDNDMARSLAYERGFGTQSLLEQWRDSYGIMVTMMMTHTMMICMKVRIFLMSFKLCDNLDIRVRGRKKK